MPTTRGRSSRPTSASRLARTGQWVCDAALGGDQCGAGSAVFGVVPALAIGIALLVGAFLAVLWVVGREPDRLTLLVGLAVLALAFFVLPTRVHERYGYPFFALGLILAAISPRWRVAYVVLSVATFLNMYVVLTTLYPDNPSISDWLGIGPAIRSEAGVALIVLLHTVAFAWCALQLRVKARDRLEDELERASVEPGAWEPEAGVAAGHAGRRLARRPRAATGVGSPRPAWSAPASPDASAAAPAAIAVAAAAAATMPTWSRPLGLAESGVVGWFRDRLAERPIRADRSASLRRETGGRLDRLDLWILAVLVVACLTLRTFRLPEPYQMHFDEVYHARTATEFLQVWRYGISHDIYEWTHPHLAKYAMALGIMAWGEDDVSATSDLGVPVRAAVVEPRRDDATAPGGRAGERLHVATGSEIRTYDLHSRALIATIAAPGVSALAIDPSGEQLVVGFDDGRLATLDLNAIGPDAAASGVTPQPLGNVAGAVDLLYVTKDGATVMVGSGEHLDALDLATGTVVGGVDLPGLVDLADGGNGAALIATIEQVDDRRRRGRRPRRAPRRRRRRLRGGPVGDRPHGHPRQPGHQRHAEEGRDRDRRRAPARHRDPGRRQGRGGDGRRGHVRRSRGRLGRLDDRARRWCPRPGRGHRPRAPEAVRDVGTARPPRSTTSS